MPTIAVRDLNIQKRENDLVVGTFGRGIYILDDYTPLRLVKPEMLRQEAAVFPIKDALMFIQSCRSADAARVFRANDSTRRTPPLGATVTWYLKDAIRTRKEKRQEAEREAERRGAPVGWPTRDQLRAEEEEDAPAIVVTITDSSDRRIRRLTGPVTAGMHDSHGTCVIPRRTFRPRRHLTPIRTSNRLQVRSSCLYLQSDGGEARRRSGDAVGPAAAIPNRC